jgi:hypothetical protein
LDLREDPQLKAKDPQPIPRISKVVRPLQDYIRMPPHGERIDGLVERYLNYDLIRKERHARHQTYDLIREIYQ